VTALSPVRSTEQIASIARLAREIWYEHYVPIIGRAQVEYMVDKFQSVAAIRDQIASGYEYYAIEHTGEAAGYVALQSQPGELFISKFYLRRAARGFGLGSATLAFIEKLSRERGLFRLALTVNKYNPALQIYLRLGFTNCGSVVADIGNGFVMDDYRMEKGLAPTE
jgi:GNAT superfamily N-acetyltransferase